MLFETETANKCQSFFSLNLMKNRRYVKAERTKCPAAYYYSAVIFFAISKNVMCWYSPKNIFSLN